MVHSLSRPTSSAPLAITRSERDGRRGRVSGLSSEKCLKKSRSLILPANELWLRAQASVQSLPSHAFNHRRAERIVKAHLQQKQSG